MSLTTNSNTGSENPTEAVLQASAANKLPLPPEDAAFLQKMSEITHRAAKEASQDV